MCGNVIQYPLSEPPAAASIVADIGGTNARFAVAVKSGNSYTLESRQAVRCEEFNGFTCALRHWLDGLQYAPPRRACIAAAGPVESNSAGGRVTMTNLGWHICAGQLSREFDLHEVRLINDFAALAHSLPFVESGGCHLLHDAQGDAEACLAVLGPGTGLGMAGLVRDNGNYRVIAGEGGHSALAPANLRELELLKILLRSQQPVSAEWVLSGGGLMNLYRAVCELNGVKALCYSPADISAAGMLGRDKVCRETLLDFLNFLGSAAGDTALCLDARGGIFLGGGIVPRILGLVPQSELVARFLSKGKASAWMERVPLYALHAGQQALIGAAARLDL